MRYALRIMCSPCAVKCSVSCSVLIIKYTVQCHAILIVSLHLQGAVYAAWQASTALEGGADQRIYYSYTLYNSTDINHWNSPLRLPLNRQRGQWSPVLLAVDEGYDERLYLFYAESRRGEWVPCRNFFDDIRMSTNANLTRQA